MPFGLTPWILLGALGFGIALGGAGYWKGHADGTDNGNLKIAALQAQAAESAQKQRQAELIQSSNASTGFQNDTAKARIIYRTIHDQVTNIVDRPIYRDVCLDDDGVRLADAALAGILTAPNPSGPNTAMPRPLATP